jgi:hypothetical protein
MAGDSRGKRSRRQFLKEAACTTLALGGLGALGTACAPAEAETGAAAPPATAPKATPGAAVEGAQEGVWAPSETHVGDLPQGEGAIQIPTVGTFQFEARAVQTVRPDLFQEGHFSLFDILVHLKERGDVQLDYHYDESAATHAIDRLDGVGTRPRGGQWWYEAHYSNGWYEANVWRMDAYPYKNGSQIRMRVASEERLAAVHRTFQEEVERLARNGGQVVIPRIDVQSPAGNWSYRDVVAEPHDVRVDVLQPGLVTALDALLSLKDQGQVGALELTWYERIGTADPVDSYWVSRFESAQAQGGCGFVYETGPQQFSGFSGAHIHIPADVRAVVSPEYALWFWLCL